MMETLTHWLAEKSQIDFGNLAVGVGAMAVARGRQKRRPGAIHQSRSDGLQTRMGNHQETLARVKTANNRQPKMKESKEHVA